MLQISCFDDDWERLLANALSNRTSVHLSDLDYTKQGAFCENLAMQHGMDLIFFARGHVGVFSATSESTNLSVGEDKALSPQRSPARVNTIPQAYAVKMDTSTGQPKLLLVEDSDDDAFFFYHFLAKTGIACVCAHVMNGKDATLYLQENQSHAHLVFLDLKLPLLGGFEVLEWLKTQPFAERMKVVIVSGSEDFKDLATAKKFGVEYLVKPVSNVSLTQKVRAWLDEQRV